MVREWITGSLLSHKIPENEIQITPSSAEKMSLRSPNKSQERKTYREKLNEKRPPNHDWKYKMAASMFRQGAAV